MPTGVPVDGRVVWTEAERLKIAAACLPLLSLGLKPADMIEKAQRKVLPKARQKTRDKIHKILFNDKARNQSEGLLHTIAKAQAMDPAELVRLTGFEPPAPKPPKAEKPPKVPKPTTIAEGRRPSVYWTKLELARLAKRVDEIIADAPKTALSGAYLQAQHILPPDRQRSTAGIYANRKHLAAYYAQGLADAWLLPKPEEPAAEPEAQETPQEPAPPVLATVPVALPFATLGGPLQAFGEAFTKALGDLLAAQAAQTLASLDAKLSAIAANVGATLAAQIESSLRKTVVDTMAAELGGPVTAPAPDANAAQAEALAGAIKPAAEAPKPPRLKVDVIGPVGIAVTTIRQAFNGGTDLRFIDVDHTQAYTPRDGCEIVINTKFSNHEFDRKAQKAGIKPIRVSGGPHVVIAAIEELHRARGTAP